ncbi:MULTISPECIES: DUF6124 family protein [Pseudomonas]|uniref:DUF3077 domain-containing protein n=1 Tax=Pseudomonas fluorescens TaxID=294 RepID=A0A7Z3H0V4_PSEFL|nr:hypothetical protein [Pseudomonas fluorescens]QJP96535.1 hypothetical protein C6Y56_18880 [Pseudomonas fluorescens]
MFKPTPNPPETDPVSPYQFPDSKKLNEAAERALDHYLTPQQRIMGSHTEHDPMFLANPAYTSESLLANASESLDSASEMLSNFAAILEPSHRKTALGIAQVVMVAGLAVNQALDHVEPKS